MLFAESYLWEFYLGIGDIRLGGDKSVSESTIYMGLLFSISFSFEFLLLQSYSSSSYPPTPVF